jgi:hypothetical protein
MILVYIIRRLDLVTVLQFGSIKRDFAHQYSSKVSLSFNAKSSELRRYLFWRRVGYSKTPIHPETPSLRCYP